MLGAGNFVKTSFSSSGGCKTEESLCVKILYKGKKVDDFPCLLQNFGAEILAVNMWHQARGPQNAGKTVSL